MWGDPDNIPNGFYICDGGQYRSGVNPPAGTVGNTPNTTYTSFSGADIPIPDLRSRFVVGYDTRDPSYNTVSDTGGSTTLSPDNIPAHSHYSAQNHTVDGNDYYLGQYNSVTTHATGGNYIGVGTSIDDAYTTSVTGQGKPYSPPYIVMLFIIRYTVPLSTDVQLYGKNIYYVPRRLGVGTFNPFAELHISEDINPNDGLKNSNWHTDISNSQLLLTGHTEDGGGLNKRLARCRYYWRLYIFARSRP